MVLHWWFVLVLVSPKSHPGWRRMLMIMMGGVRLLWSKPPHSTAMGSHPICDTTTVWGIFDCKCYFDILLLLKLYWCHVAELYPAQAVASSLRWSCIWSTRELLGAPVVSSQQAGARFPILGWSGIFDRKISNFSLNIRISHIAVSLMCCGSESNNLAPWIFKDASLRALTLADALWQSGRILTRRPFLFCLHVTIPGLGTCPSIIFQTYIILYCSNLLCWLFIFNLIRRS